MPDATTSDRADVAEIDTGRGRSRMAFSDGGPLSTDEHAPRTLAEALLRTASTY